MKQRIFAVAAAFCLLAAPGAFAQNGNRKAGVSKERPTVEQMTRRQTERMTRELGLDEVQAKKVYAINLKRNQQMEAVRTEMQKNRQAEAAEMKSVLSAEQYDKWSQMQGPMPRAHRGKVQKDGKQGCCQQGQAGKENKQCSRKARTK